MWGSCRTALVVNGRLENADVVAGDTGIDLIATEGGCMYRCGLPAGGTHWRKGIEMCALELLRIVELVDALEMTEAEKVFDSTPDETECPVTKQ